jgi:UDP-N-acetyl-D-mannosaminuronic acid dehydrogenase
LKCCVLGLGYIGLPTAALLAARGHDVLGVDVDPQRLDLMVQGVLRESGLMELIEVGVLSGRLRTGTTVHEADTFVICVPTPHVAGRQDLTLADVLAAIESIAPHLRKGNLVVLESTVPPGTTDDVIRPCLDRLSGLSCGSDYFLAYCPERVLPGNLVHELAHNARIVGGVDDESGRRAAALFRTIVSGEVLVTGSRTAEMSKLMENTYAAVNIALANELAWLAEYAGIDVREAIALANRHPRVNLMNPGPGVGGHCIPVDPWFLVDGTPASACLISQALRTNDGMPGRVASAIGDALARIGKPISGARVVLMGVAYKGGVDDVRESPALGVATWLWESGADVIFQDPIATGFPHPVEPDLLAAVSGADALAVIADHPQYLGLELLLPRLRRLMRPNPLFVDTRGVVKSAEGFLFWRLGCGFAKDGNVVLNRPAQPVVSEELRKTS